MPDIKLGTSGSEVTLPTLRGVGQVPSMAVDKSPNVERTTMSDGTNRFARYTDQRKWVLEWGYLTAAQYASIETVRALTGLLHFQNGYESTDWYDVYITSFQVTPLVDIYGGAAVAYAVKMTVEQAG